MGENTWGGKIDMEKKFALETCKIGLLDVGIEEYLFNLEMIRDAAKLLDKK